MAKIITEDLEAILTALRASSPLSAIVNSVDYLQADVNVKQPYVLIYDINLTPVEAFGHTIVAENGLYAIRAITVDTETESASTVAQNIHAAIKDTLHGVKIPISGFVTLTLRIGSREPTRWENVSSEERYLHTGYKWLATFAGNS